MKMCESIVCEMVRNVHTPERPGSPAEFFITEEQRFTNRNSKVNPAIPNPMICDIDASV